ncbi:hypothetical protein GCM10027589_16840 [Actinocorallia lasiicapitis]
MFLTVLIRGSSTGFIVGPRWAPSRASRRRTRAADGGIEDGAAPDEAAGRGAAGAESSAFVGSCGAGESEEAVGRAEGTGAVSTSGPVCAATISVAAVSPGTQPPRRVTIPWLKA